MLFFEEILLSCGVKDNNAYHVLVLNFLLILSHGFEFGKSTNKLSKSIPYLEFYFEYCIAK